jgi:hypothetical protein
MASAAQQRAWEESLPDTEDRRCASLLITKTVIVSVVVFSVQGNEQDSFGVISAGKII